jgi:predicted O-methyltransferase YrrM
MKNPMHLLETIRAFMKSRILLTAVELDLFTRIDRGVDSAEKLAENSHLDVRALTRLLDAVTALGFLNKENRRYSLSPDNPWLSADHPDNPLPMVRHMNELWDTWSHLTESVRIGKNPAHTPVSEKNEHALNAFIGAMDVIGRSLAREITADLDLSSYRKLLDIGGASGTYTIAFLQKNPDMTSVIFDLKPVLPLAAKRLRESGFSDRVELTGGDFYTDPLPIGCDLALLSAIIHQNSPAQNLDLYQKIHEAIEPGGTLMIRDHIMDEVRTSPPAGTVFALNMLVATDGGDTYTFREIEQSLKTAGFNDIRQIRHGGRMDGIVTARKL